MTMPLVPTSIQLISKDNFHQKVDPNSIHHQIKHHLCQVTDSRRFPTSWKITTHNFSLNTLDLSTAQKGPDRGPSKINKWTEKEQRKWAYASDFDGPAAFSKEQERLLLFEESSALTTHHYIIL